MSSESEEIEQPQQQHNKPLKYTVNKRLNLEGRWKEIEPVRDELMREARKVKKLPKDEAQDWTYAELDRRYPPLPTTRARNHATGETTGHSGESKDMNATGESQIDGPPIGLEVEGDDSISTATEATDLPLPAPITSHPRTRGESIVTGLNEIPPDWPPMAANAGLPVEIQWVQSNRLRCVTETGDGTTVDLSQALAPAPSYAAIGWLETSIRAYAKYCEIAAKATQAATDETEVVRREKKSIQEVRDLLAEMLKTDENG